MRNAFSVGQQVIEIGISVDHMAQRAQQEECRPPEISDRRKGTIYSEARVQCPIRSVAVGADFDFTVGQCLVSDENSACCIPITHNLLSNGDVRAYVSCDSV